MNTRKIVVRVLLVFMAVLILALAAAGTLILFNYAEYYFVHQKFVEFAVSGNDIPGIEPITIRPEQESYKKGVDEIKLIISDPSGVGFCGCHFFQITKEDNLLKVWPASLNDAFNGHKDLYPYAFSASPSQDGAPITLTYTLKPSDWSFRPTRGTYTYTTLIRAEVNGVYYTSELSCDFIIE